MAPRKLTVYKTYRFQHHDPVIDVVRTLVHDSDASYQKIHEASNVATQTIGNWLNGKTKRPQYATIAAVVHALNGRVAIVNGTGKTVRPTTAKNGLKNRPKGVSLKRDPLGASRVG